MGFFKAILKVLRSVPAPKPKRKPPEKLVPANWMRPGEIDVVLWSRRNRGLPPPRGDENVIVLNRDDIKIITDHRKARQAALLAQRREEKAEAERKRQAKQSEVERKRQAKRKISELVKERKAQKVPLQKIYNELYAIGDSESAKSDNDEDYDYDIDLVDAGMTAADKLLDVIVDRNNCARDLLKVGDIEQAVKLLRANVKDHDRGSYPYERLMRIYDEPEHKKNLIWVCESYIQNVRGDDDLAEKCKHILEGIANGTRWAK